MTAIALSNVQSLVLRGFRLHESAPSLRYVYLQVREVADARAWLGALTTQVTSCTNYDKNAVSVGVALSFEGLGRLGCPSEVTWPDAFSQGMALRAERLGDTGTSAPAQWSGPLAAAELHLVIALSGPTQAQLDATWDALRPRGVIELGTDRANHLANKPDGTEHFGFVDGIGQPDVEGSGLDAWPGEGTPERKGHWNPVKAGEFVLGYPTEPASRPRSVHAFQKDGSYFVLRKLYEDVPAFRAYVTETARSSKTSESWVAAKMVGRWQSGAPLVLCPHDDDVPLSRDLSKNNNFHYTDDPKGHACPFGAHIRRANPRDDPTGPSAAQVRSHRIIRRALPYGPWLPEGTTDEVDRGVMFGVINADIENQFEYVQRNWMNSTISSRDLSIEADKDPLTGAHDGTGKLLIPGRKHAKFCWDLPRFVETRAGAYFFVPSLDALATLARGTA